MSKNLSVRFPIKLYEKLKIRANEYGISLADYIRHLILNDIEKATKCNKTLLPQCNCNSCNTSNIGNKQVSQDKIISDNTPQYDDQTDNENCE